MSVLHKFKTQFMKWLIFNLFTFPFIALFYVPYNIWWLNYTTLQLLKWFLTAGAMGAFFNLFYRPYVAYVTHYLDRRHAKKLNDSNAESGETADVEHNTLNTIDVPLSTVESQK